MVKDGDREIWLTGALFYWIRNDLRRQTTKTKVGVKSQEWINWEFSFPCKM